MEALMQYVWQYRLWPPADMATVDGKRIDVLDVGILNRDAGPDFFNAKIIIDGQLWSGNVEIHINASDWYRHGHDHDPAYASVVLHVVENSDADVYRPDGQKIPQMVMPCARDFSQKYHELVSSNTYALRCAPELGSFTSLHLCDWITALAHERLYEKADRVMGHVQAHDGNWSDAVYITLARALGFGINSEPFELLAMSTPLRVLMRYSGELMQIEALLFGQAGLIAEDTPDDYAQQLLQEYKFLAAKHRLRRNEHIVWKMSRTRPQNFPHRRIATMALMIYRNFSIFNQLLQPMPEAEARAMFDYDAVGYWARHYNFGAPNAPHVKVLSQSSITSLLINVSAPVAYAYAQATAHDAGQQQVIDMLQSLKPEKNSVTEIFTRAGIAAPDAFTTQALIQLYRAYCEPRKCLFCRIGHRLLSHKAKRR